MCRHLKCSGITVTSFHNVSPKMTQQPKDNPFKLSDFLWLTPPQILPRNEKSTISARKIRSSVQELMTKLKHIRSGSSGWSNQPRLERGNLLLTKVWFDRDWQVHPERKHRSCEVVTRWDETAAGQTGKQYLKAEHLGSVTRSACFHHALSAHFIPANTHAYAHRLVLISS